MAANHARRVRAIAATAGLTIEASKVGHYAEVSVICRPGHCFPHECHERIFSAPMMAGAWEMAADEIAELAASQVPCTAHQCVSWDDNDAHPNACGWWTSRDA